MTRTEVLAALLAENGNRRTDDCAIYATAFSEYQEAASRIVDNGTVVSHPRTGAPIDNPYLKIRAAAERTMRACKIRVPAGLWT